MCGLRVNINNEDQNRRICFLCRQIAISEIDAAWELNVTQYSLTNVSICVSDTVCYDTASKYLFQYLPTHINSSILF